MSGLYELHAKINELRRGLTDKPVEHTLDLLLSLLSQVISGVERQWIESGQTPLRRSLDESRMTLLTGRVESLEADAQWDRRRIEKHLEAINKKLDNILARVPEPPRSFDE
jgi:energy-converting hydrogenase A subunit M